MAIKGDNAADNIELPLNEGDDDEVELSRDDVFDVLSNPRRRYALHALRGADGELELGEVAEQVAAWENRTTVDDIGADERKHAYTALQQRHLPRMDDKGVVDFDRRAGVVAPTAALDRFDIYLEVVSDREIPWSQYYLGLGGVATALAAALQLNAPVVSAVPPAQWLVFLGVAVLVSGGAHHLYARKTRLAASGVPPEIED
jgi:hypothetical protein